MQPTLIDIILVSFGLFTLYGVVFKPDFYWQTGRIKRTREIIGDRKTTIMYVAVGVIMLAVGVMGALGAF